MITFITTYAGRGSGVFPAETRDQAINSVYETLKDLGIAPDRRLINAWPVRKKAKKQTH